jgi:hypothetical protein
MSIFASMPGGRVRPNRPVRVYGQAGDLTLDLVDFGLHLVDLAAQIVRDLLDRHAALVHIEQVRHVHLGPRLA